MIVMLLDASKGEIHKKLLTKELEECGIRINRTKPNITFRPKKTGGIQYTSTVKQSEMTESLAKDILREYKIHNAEIVLRHDCTVDDFIDVIEGNRQYIRCVFVYNKIDTISLEELDEIARADDMNVMISCNQDLNLDFFVQRIYEELRLIRVYTKKKGDNPDFQGPVICREGSTVNTICRGIHSDLLKTFRYAFVWGKSVKYSPQRVGLSHELTDEDVIQLFY